jgi:hypothetical protein
MTPARIDHVELVESGVPAASGSAEEVEPIVERQLSLAVESAPGETAEIPIFLPFDGAEWHGVDMKNLKLRVRITREGAEPGWSEAHVYTSPDGGVP